MIRKLLAPLAAAALALILPGTAAAQAPAAAGTETADLATRFDPPLDKPLRYKLTQEKVREGKAESTVLEQEATYSRGSAGVVMTLRPLRVTTGATTIDLTDPKAPLPPMLKPLMGPVAFDLDSDGSIVRVRGWEGYKKNLIAVIPAIAVYTEPDPAKRPQAEKFIRDFFDNYLSASAEEAPHLVMKGWPDVLDIMGVSAPAGELMETETEELVPFFPKPINYTVTVQMSQVAGGILRIEVTSVPDPAELKAAIISLAETIRKSAPQGSTKKPIDPDDELAAIDLTTHMVVDLDSRTGLVRRAVTERNIKTHESKAFDRITIEAM
jgi:hypothetical protein